MASPNQSASGINESHKQPQTGAGPVTPRRYKRIVVKAGTSVLTGAPDNGGLALDVMGDLARQISQLKREQSADVALVTSGAIAAGREALQRGDDVNLGRDIPSRQVLAAIGQTRLMHTYQELFARHHVQVAQTLLTINDLSDRQSYLNVRNTLMSLLDIGLAPIVNENDVVAVDEIGEVFGDNDRLSALVANLIDADLLIILSDVDGLYTEDPRVSSNARLIPRVEQVDGAVEALAGTHRNPWARGGMPTKIEAARLVTASGIDMVICRGRDTDAVLRAAMGEEIGTLFVGRGEKLEARKRWMLNRVKDSQWGEIIVDAGAAGALRSNSVSLLPAGVREVRGAFRRGDIIYISSEDGHHVACGIANYASADVARIQGYRSDRIQELLGYHYGQEVVHRNNLVLLTEPTRAGGDWNDTSTDPG